MDRTPEELCKSMLGATIEGVLIDGENNTVKLTLNKGIVEFDGEFLEMYVEITDFDS
jgi:hypothetical protein